MKQVEFARFSTELCGYGFGKGTRYGFEGVEALIRERLEAGWDYCGYVPIESRGNGELETISLVFQRDG